MTNSNHSHSHSHYDLFFCLTIVLYPDSPAPNNNNLTSLAALAASIRNCLSISSDHLSI